MSDLSAERPAGYRSVTDAARHISVDGSVLRRSIVDNYLPATRVGGMWFVNDIVLEAFVTLGREGGRPTPYMQQRRQWVGDLLRTIATLVPPLEEGDRPSRAAATARRRRPAGQPRR